VFVAVNSTQCALSSSPGVRARSPNSCLANTTIERPSGVSSARLDICAASASASGDTPVTGTKAAACRLPSVMVPVLSSSSVLTVARGLNRPARHGQHIALHQAVHACDADG